MTIENLQAHYGFTRSPFSKALAPQMLHRPEAVARIGWCLTERALGVITGEVGAGRTVAVRAALAALGASRATIVYLPNPAVGARGLYAGIVLALGGTPRYQKSMLIPQTAELLAAEEHERGRGVVIVLDEAHLLDADQLEELRLLSNAELDSHSPFACLLVGQPTLRRRIKLGTFAAPSPPWTSGSPCATPWAGCKPPRPRPTSPITSGSPAAPTPCSATTPPN
jgi:type II secretory pathway predicted ATPase ExeA